MNFIRNMFQSRFFKYNFPTQPFLGTLSAIAFGYFIKNYYFSFNRTKNKIENIVEKYIPYEEKYNQKFENTNSDDKCIFSQEKIRQTIYSLTENYKRNLYKFQQEYADIESYYYNNDDESDGYDDDINDDKEAILLKDKIINLKILLRNEDQIETNALDQCLTDVKLSLMNSLQNNFILENTPTGNVIMVYNCKKEGFSYFSDRSITNKYLESVCKKYCIQFKCKILFNNVFINEGKMANFKFLKNEVNNNNKKNGKLSFRSFKEQFSLF